MLANTTTYHKTSPSPTSFLAAHVTQPHAHAMPLLKPYILCTQEAHTNNQPPINPALTHTIQIIDFTYCHDNFPLEAIRNKQDKHKPLINTLQNLGWDINISSP